MVVLGDVIGDGFGVLCGLQSPQKSNGHPLTFWMSFNYALHNIGPVLACPLFSRSALHSFEKYGLDLASFVASRVNKGDDVLAGDGKLAALDLRLNEFKQVFRKINANCGHRLNLLGIIRAPHVAEDKIEIPAQTTTWTRVLIYLLVQ